MPGDIQTDRIGAIPIRADMLFGLRSDTIQSCRRWTRRSITAAAVYSIVDVNIAAISNRRGFSFVGRVSIVIVQYGFYRPFAISALPDNGISQYNPVCNFRRFIHCASVIISVDIDCEVYGRCVSINRGDRIEFFKFSTIISAPMDGSAFFHILCIRPGQNERGEGFYDKVCSNAVHDIFAHGYGHRAVRFVCDVCNNLGHFGTDVGHHEGFHVHVVGVDSCQRLVRDFHCNGNGSFRFNEFAGSRAAE